jgi:nicotinate-nucleotide adenylyltransferase
VARPCALKTWSSFTIPADKGVVGILGGTFDPIHAGHLAAAEELRDRAGLDEVWLMPNALPPHRSPPAASAADRLAMVRLAIAGRPGLRASDLEVRRGGISYTIDTVDEVRREFPDRRFAWLIGSDQARAIRQWKEPDRLLAGVDFIVFNRPGVTVLKDELTPFGFSAPRTRLVTVTTPSIAAHEIREALRSRRPVDELLSAAVRTYIEERGLYR